MRSLRYLSLGLALSAACGSVKNAGELPDAPPPPDDAAEMPIDATPRGRVTVTVLEPTAGTPAVGATVVFFDPDGSLVKRAATDSAGKASAEVLPGASVTSIVLGGTAYDLQTVLGIAPGDDIILGIKPRDTSAAGTLTVLLPAAPTATTYAVSSPCGSRDITANPGVAPMPLELPIGNSCKAATAEMVVLARDVDSKVVGALTRADVRFLTSSTIDLTTETYGAPTRFAASYTNIDPIVTVLTARRVVPDFAGVVAVAPAPLAGTVSSVIVPSGVGSTAVAATQFEITGGSIQGVRQDLPGTTLSYSLDTRATLLPWLLAPSFDAANGTLVIPSNTTGGSADKPDAVRIGVLYARPNASLSFAWTLFAPTAADIKLPALPADIGDIAPTAADTVLVCSAMFEADSVAGYDAIRNDPSFAFRLYGPTSAKYPHGTVRNSVSPLLGLVRQRCPAHD